MGKSAAEEKYLKEKGKQIIPDQ